MQRMERRDIRACGLIVRGRLPPCARPAREISASQASAPWLRL